MPTKNTIIALLIVFAGLGVVVTGGVNFLLLPAILAAFYLYWRSAYFSWPLVITVIVVLLLLAIAAYAYLLAYAQGWEY